MDINIDLISNFAIALLAILNPVEKIPLWVLKRPKAEKRTFSGGWRA